MGFFSELLGYFIDGIFWLVDVFFDAIDAISKVVDEILDTIEMLFTEEDIEKGALEANSIDIVQPDVVIRWMEDGVVEVGNPVETKKRVKAGKASMSILGQNGNNILGSKLVGSEKGFDRAIQKAFDEGRGYRAPIHMS